MDRCGYKGCRSEGTIGIRSTESPDFFGHMCLKHADEFQEDMLQQAKENEERYPDPVLVGSSQSLAEVRTDPVQREVCDGRKPGLPPKPPPAAPRVLPLWDSRRPNPWPDV